MIFTKTMSAGLKKIEYLEQIAMCLETESRLLSGQ